MYELQFNKSCMLCVPSCVIMLLCFNSRKSRVVSQDKPFGVTLFCHFTFEADGSGASKYVA